MLFQKASEFTELFRAFQEQWSLADVGLVVSRIYDAVADIVMKVGTRTDFDAFVIHRLVEAFQQRCIGPYLIGRVNGLNEAATQCRFDDGVFGCGVGLAPLLQLDQYGLFCLVFVATGE
ncbi:hypothetical protein D3C79_732680 [compost metagenome]